MACTIEQVVEFSGTTPEQLFDIYLDKIRHGDAIGAPVEVSRDEGAAFEAFGGGVRGRNLLILPGRMVVQSWRGTPWSTSDVDSVLVLSFEASAAGAAVRLVQAMVPEAAGEVIAEGWHRMYWEPWRAYLRAGRR